MRFIAVRILTFVCTLLLGGPAFARVVYCDQRLAPADQQTLPANAQALIILGKRTQRFNPEDAGTIVWTPFIRRLNSDGGVQSLLPLPAELQPPGGDSNGATLFLPGPLSPGERITLESSAECGAEEPSAQVFIADPAPNPSVFGVPFSPPSILVEPSKDQFRGIGEHASRDIFIDIDESVRPWLSVARVNLDIDGNTRSTDYGRMARNFDGGSRVFVDRLTRICNRDWAGEPSNTVQTWLIKLELELPGVAERPPAVELTAEMDCRQSCASTGAAPWLIGALLLAARRVTNRFRRT